MYPIIYYILKKRSLYVTDTANLLKNLQNVKNFYFIQLSDSFPEDLNIL